MDPTHLIAAIGLEDGLSWEDVVAFAASVTTVLTCVMLIMRPIWREWREFATWWRKFQRDWDGEPEEPGRHAIPGVMTRLNEIDGQLKRNGGESLKDKVCDTHDLALGLAAKVSMIEVRQAEIRDDQIQMRLDIESLTSKRA